MSPSSLGELAHLSRGALLARLREAERRAERAEARLAFWAWSYVLGEISQTIRDTLRS